MSELYTLLGCFVDQSPNRTLNITAYQGNDSNTANSCHGMCNVPQFQAAYFGLEYGTECYCGGRDAALRFTPAASLNECNKPCPQNASEMCGSDWRLNIYQILDTTIVPSPSPNVAPTIAPLPSSSTGPGDSGNGTTPPPSTTPASNQETDGSGGSHLSGGSIAGIGVAAFVVVALLAVLVVFLMRRRQQRGQKGRRLARPGTGTSAGPQSGAGATEAGAEGGAGGVQMAGATGAMAGAGAGGGSGSNSREGGLASGKAKAAGAVGNTASVDGDSLVAGAPYHHHPHNDELPGYQSSAR
ncbi:hypothetical protein PG984_011401 [Apiospora sp. TS-2023a]